MKKLLLIAAALPVMASAQNYGNRAQNERDLIQAVNATRRLVLENVQRMPQRDLLQAQKLLEKVDEVVLGRSTGPQIPQVRGCALENVNSFQQTFVRIKNFAFSGTGLNYNSNDATDFADRWTSRYPCSYADHYMAVFMRLKSFAFSGAGLNYDSKDAVQFALANVDSFCSDMQLEQLFKQHYNFAFSGTGLNMDSNEARAYAYNKIRGTVFSCSNI